MNIITEYHCSGDFYQTQLMDDTDGGYLLLQSTGTGGPATPGQETVFLDKPQAIKYAKAILRNEGIHAID